MTKKLGSGEAEMSFLEHLEALRWHLVRSLVAIVVIAVGVFLAKSFVFEDIILAPLTPEFFSYKFICSISDMLCFYPPNIEVYQREIGEQFITHLKVSFWLGLILAFPYVFYEVWSFIKPGLYQKEQKAARGIVWICSFLFILGVGFGYFVISPFAVSFLGGYQVAEIMGDPEVQLGSFVGYLTMFTLPTGIVFELPVIMFFLAKVGLISSGFLKEYRRHAFIIILVSSAIITPPDVITQFLIGVPLYGLYEVSIVIAKRVEKKRKEKEDEDD
jgi:sec-independent protein translocase protein TatC